MLLKLSLLIVVISFPVLINATVVAQNGQTVDVYFGTANNNVGVEAGIYRSSFSQDAAKIGPAVLVQKLSGAGWVTTHPNNADVIYSSGEVDGVPSVVAISINETAAQIVSVQPTGDGGACFLTTDQTGKMLISAHYGGGSISVYPLETDGKIGKRRQLIEHSGGSKVVAGRQDSSHPHYVSISPDNRYAFVPDLGLDQLVAYRIDLKNGELLPHQPVDTIPGGGPRHMKFHPSGKFAFVLNELALSLTVFRYDAKSGTMEQLHTVETLTDSEKAENNFNSASEIRLNGESFIYTANRGHDSISVFRFDFENAALKRIQLASIHGSWPRNFNISPDGQTLLAAGQNSNSVTLFSIKDGLIRHKEQKSVFVPGPICVAFAAE